MSTVASNIKLTYAAATIISAAVSVSSVSAAYDYKREAVSIAARASTISFTTELVPMRSLAPDSVSVTDTDYYVEVGKVLGDTLTTTDSPVMTVDIAKTDSVNVVDVPNKIINTNIDFDLSDPDVDPDPINVSDSPVKNILPAGKTDSISVSDSPVKQPNKIPTDSVTIAESIGPFSVGKNLSDSVTATENVDSLVTGNIKVNSISVSDLPAMTVTPAGKTDSISVSDSPSLQANKFPTDSVTAAEVFGPVTVGKNPSDAVSATESIATTLILGESNYLYPTRVSVFDGAETGQVRGYHIGNSNVSSRVADTNYLMNDEFNGMFNNHYLGGENRDGIRFYNRVFEQDRFRARVTDYSAQIANGDSLLNSAVIWDSATDGAGIKEFTGVLNGGGLVGQPIVNSDTITYGDLVNAGLLVNFIYTDTSDSPTTGSHAVNGHFLNETPMGAGSH